MGFYRPVMVAAQLYLLINIVHLYSRLTAVKSVVSLSV